MAFELNFDKMKESIVNVGKDMEEFAKNTSNTAKIKYDIHTKEAFIEKQYTVLGKAYYEAHKDEEVPEQECFNSIKEAEEELAKLNEELLKAQGAVECPSCGAKQDDANAFCSSCGTALVKEEEAADEVVATVEAEEVQEAEEVPNVEEVQESVLDEE